MITNAVRCSVHTAQDQHPQLVIGHGVKIANAMGRACAATTCRCVTGSARTQRYEMDNQK